MSRRFVLVAGVVLLLLLVALERRWFGASGSARHAGANAAQPQPLSTDALAALRAVSGAWTGKPQKVSINGHTVDVGSTVFARPARDVLDAYAEACDFAAVSGVRPPPGGLGERPAIAPQRFAPVAREELDGRGAIVCAPKGEPDEPPTLADSTPFRYAYAETLSDGETVLFHVASDDAMPLETIFPAHGDAPGRDLEGVARPRASRRVLHATVDGSDEAVVVYISPEAPEAVRVAYERDMLERGWTNSRAVAETMAETRSFSRDGRDIVVSFQPAEQGVVVALKELRAPGTP